MYILLIVILYWFKASSAVDLGGSVMRLHKEFDINYLQRQTIKSKSYLAVLIYMKIAKIALVIHLFI